MEGIRLGDVSKSKEYDSGMSPSERLERTRLRDVPKSKVRETPLLNGYELLRHAHILVTKRSQHPNNTNNFQSVLKIILTAVSFPMARVASCIMDFDTMMDRVLSGCFGEYIRQDSLKPF